LRGKWKTGKKLMAMENVEKVLREITLGDGDRRQSIGKNGRLNARRPAKADRGL
jgi:hypothetical protein